MLTGSGFAPPVSIDIPTLDEMYYGFNEARPTRLQRELGFDLIGLSAPMRIVTHAYKT
jgi:hypothetical protein